MAFNVKMDIYIYIYNVRVNGYPVHQEGMLSNKLRQYVASNTKLGRCNVRVNGYE